MFKFNQTHMEQVITSIKNTKKDVTAVKNKINGIKSDDVMINVDIRAAYTKLKEVESQIDNVGIWMENQKNSVLNAESKNNALINSIFQVGSPWLYATFGRASQQRVETAKANINSALPGARQQLIMDTCVQLNEDLIARGARYTTDNADPTGKTGLVEYDIKTCSEQALWFCCASYTTTVLYRAGELTEEQCNAYYYQGTGSGGIPNMLENAGWTKVDPSVIQTGDVANKYGYHVMIYAGEGRLWDNQSALISSTGTPPTRTTRECSYLSDCDIYRMPDKTMDDLSEKQWENLKPYLPAEDVKIVEEAKKIEQEETKQYVEKDDIKKVSVKDTSSKEEAKTNGNKTNKENIKKVTLD